MVQRLQYRRRHSYNTKSNKQKRVKTPGGKLVFQQRRKLAKGVKCSDCDIILPGIPHLRPKQLRNVARRYKSVNRAYGGKTCGPCVRDKIVRSYLASQGMLAQKVIAGK